MGQAYSTEDDQNPSTDCRDGTHNHGTDDETGVGVLATADTETARDDEEYRAPYSSPKYSNMESGRKQTCKNLGTWEPSSRTFLKENPDNFQKSKILRHFVKICFDIEKIRFNKIPISLYS